MLLSWVAYSQDSLRQMQIYPRMKLIWLSDEAVDGDNMLATGLLASGTLHCTICSINYARTLLGMNAHCSLTPDHNSIMELLR